MMVNAMRSKGRPFEYLLFKCEQCGFRIAENIKRALDAELYFKCYPMGKKRMCSLSLIRLHRPRGRKDAKATAIRPRPIRYQAPRTTKSESLQLSSGFAERFAGVAQ